MPRARVGASGLPISNGSPRQFPVQVQTFLSSLPLLAGGGINVLKWRNFSNFSLMQLLLGQTDTRFWTDLEHGWPAPTTALTSARVLL
jgi:hypothetical protein